MNAVWLPGLASLILIGIAFSAHLIFRPERHAERQRIPPPRRKPSVGVRPKRP